MCVGEQLKSLQATTDTLLFNGRSTLSEESSRNKNFALKIKPLKHHEYHDTRANCWVCKDPHFVQDYLPILA
jgi:hypothetical protein